MSNNTDNYSAQGGGEWVVGGELNIATGGTITANGTQASVIADPTGGSTTDAEARTAINAIIDALQGVGIVATS